MPSVQALRAVLAAVAVSFVLACGGGDAAPSAPPTHPRTPTPPAPVASVISGLSGDGQQALAEATLPVNPKVLVADASGRPFAGAVVTFRVDSGGSSIARPSATTGVDGLADAGPWQLGVPLAETWLQNALWERKICVCA